MENNKVEIFKNEQFGAVRTIEEDGKVLFCAKDIAEALGYAVPRKAIFDHCRCVLKRNVPHPQSPDKQIEMTFIPEGDVYRLIARSKLPKAQEFESWVFDEVVPSVVKHGAYMTEATLESCLNNPDFAIGLLTALKEEREKNNALAVKVAEQSHQIEEMAPKATYYDIILNCKDAVPITNISKDYGMSAIAMNAKLHELGVQYKQGEMWLLYQKYASHGYTQSKTFATEKDRSKMHTYWTQKGRVFLYEFLKEHGIVPTMERNEEN